MEQQLSIREISFKYQKPSWIEANQSIIKKKKKTSSLSYTIYPLEDGTPFVKNYTTFESSDTSVVRVDRNGKITTVKAGTANITIRYSGKNPLGYDTYLPSNITITVNVIRTPTIIQSLYWADTLNVKDQGTFTSYVSPSKGRGTLTYTCNDSQVLTVSSDGYYRALSAGTVNVTVSYSGDDTYAPSQVSFTVKVNRKPTSINDLGFDSMDLDLNNQYASYVYLNPSRAGELKCLSNDTAVATAELEYESFKIMGVGPGLAKVTFYFEGNDEYEPCSMDLLVNVIAYETKINVDETLDVYMGYNGRIEYDIEPYNIFYLVFTSNDTNVIRFVDDYGNFEAVGNGVANVTIDLIGNGKYLSSTANVIVTVSSVETSITVDPSFDLYVGQNKNINAKLNPNAGSLIYKSNDTNVVSINENGFMRVLNEGVAEITVSYTGVGRYLSSNATVIVNVQKGPTRIDVEDEIVIYITDSAKYLNARLISEWENQPVNVGLEYLCNDTSVLKMNGKYMNARKVGEVELTIGFAGSNKYLPSSKKILVRVVLEPTEITAPSEIILLNGETDNLNATLNHAGQLNFLSDNPDVVTVDDGGNIAACGIGKANITITFNETDKYAPASKTVVIEVVGSKVQTTILANERKLNLCC